MSIKDKIAIVLIILTLVLFGIAMDKSIGSITHNGTTMSSLNDLASYASNYGTHFMDIPISSLKDVQISGGVEQEEIYYKSGICTYHNQSNKASGVKYNIADVLDFTFSNEGIQVSRNGSKISTNETAGTLSKALYTAYNNLPSYEKSKNQAYHNYKEAIRTALINAINTGGVAVDSKFYTGVKDEPYTGGDLLDKNYGTDAINFQGITKNIQDSNIQVQSANGYTMIGPLNVSFSGRNIEKIRIESASGSKEGVNGGEIYYTTYFTNVNEAIADIAGLSNEITTIPSGHNFYIIVSDSNQQFTNGNNLKVTMYQQSMEYYKGRMVLAISPQATGQNFSIFAAERQYYNGEQTFNVNIPQPKQLDLTIVKYGDNNKELPNVEFYLSRGEGTQYYAKWAEANEENGIMVYRGVTFELTYVNINEGANYVFKTGSSGKFIVKELDGSDIYSVQEINNPNDGYSKKDIKNATLSSGNSIQLSKSKDSETNDLVTGIKLTDAVKDNILEIIDRKGKSDPLDLTIEKKGDNGLDQPNVEFYLSRGEGIQYYAKWAEAKNENGVMVYSGVTFDNDYVAYEQNVFKTGTSGRFVVKDLDASYSYSVKEIKNPNAGYSHIDIIGARLNSSSSVTIDSFDGSKKDLVKGIRLTLKDNILYIKDGKYPPERRDDPEYFDIIINKVNTSGTKVAGAEFKVKVKDGGNVVGWLYYNSKNKEWDYNKKYSKSTTWSTAEGDNENGVIYAKNQGIIKLSNLTTEYQYEIHEFKPATGYYSLRTQALSGSMKVTIDGKTTTMSEKNYVYKTDEVDSPSIRCGTVSNNDDSSVTVKVTNIKGRRWRRPEAAEAQRIIYILVEIYG